MVYAGRMIMIARVLLSLLMVVSIFDTAAKAVPRVRAIDVSTVSGSLEAGTCEVGKPVVVLHVERRICRREGTPAANIPCHDFPGMLSELANQRTWWPVWTPIDFRATSPRDTVPDRILDPPRRSFRT